MGMTISCSPLPLMTPSPTPLVDSLMKIPSSWAKYIVPLPTRSPVVVQRTPCSSPSPSRVPVNSTSMRAHSRPLTVSKPSSVLMFSVAMRMLARPVSSVMLLLVVQLSPTAIGLPGMSGKTFENSVVSPRSPAGPMLYTTSAAPSRSLSSPSFDTVISKPLPSTEPVSGASSPWGLEIETSIDLTVMPTA